MHVLYLHHYHNRKVEKNEKIEVQVFKEKGVKHLTKRLSVATTDMLQ